MAASDGVKAVEGTPLNPGLEDTKASKTIDNTNTAKNHQHLPHQPLVVSNSTQSDADLRRSQSPAVRSSNGDPNLTTTTNPLVSPHPYYHQQSQLHYPTAQLQHQQQRQQQQQQIPHNHQQHHPHQQHLFQHMTAIPPPSMVGAHQTPHMASAHLSPIQHHMQPLHPGTIADLSQGMENMALGATHMYPMAPMPLDYGAAMHHAGSPAITSAGLYNQGYLGAAPMPVYERDISILFRNYRPTSHWRQVKDIVAQFVPVSLISHVRVLSATSAIVKIKGSANATMAVAAINRYKLPESDMLSASMISYTPAPGVLAPPPPGTSSNGGDSNSSSSSDYLPQEWTALQYVPSAGGEFPVQIPIPMISHDALPRNTTNNNNNNNYYNISNGNGFNKHSHNNSMSSTHSHHSSLGGGAVGVVPGAGGPSRKYITSNGFHRQKLYIGNIPYNTQWQDLKDFLRGGAPIYHVEIPHRSEDEYMSRGFAIATFYTEQDAERAIEQFDGVQFQGRQLRVRHLQQPAHFNSFQNNFTPSAAAEDAALKANGTIPESNEVTGKTEEIQK